MSLDQIVCCSDFSDHSEAGFRFIGETDANLAVVGAFGLSGMGRVLFGSVPKRIAPKAPCSVMIVRNKPA